MEKDRRVVGLDPKVRTRILQYKQSFGSEAGVEALKDLAAYCQIGSSSYIKREGESSDPIEMAFLEGRKSVYYHIQQILSVDLPPE